jgi:hypothetical protein
MTWTQEDEQKLRELQKKKDSHTWESSSKKAERLLILEVENLVDAVEAGIVKIEHIETQYGYGNSKSCTYKFWVMGKTPQYYTLSVNTHH